MKLSLIYQQCSTFKLETGMLGRSWTTWTFETYFSVDQVYGRIRGLPAGHFVKVYGFDMLNNDWVKLLHKPILRRVK